MMYITSPHHYFHVDDCSDVLDMAANRKQAKDERNIHLKLFHTMILGYFLPEKTPKYEVSDTCILLYRGWKLFSRLFQRTDFFGVDSNECIYFSYRGHTHKYQLVWEQSSFPSTFRGPYQHHIHISSLLKWRLTFLRLTSCITTWHPNNTSYFSCLKTFSLSHGWCYKSDNFFIVRFNRLSRFSFYIPVCLVWKQVSDRHYVENYQFGYS